MRSSITTVLRSRAVIATLSALLAFGAVACDDTADGVQTDTEELGDEVEQIDEGTDQEAETDE